MVTSFKFGKDGFIIRLPSLNEMVEDASELVSGVFGGLEGTVARALRTVIIAQVGLIVVKGESRHTKRLRNAVFGFDLGSADAPSGTGTIFWAEVEPGAERVVGWKWRQIRAEFTEDGLNAEHVKAGDSREIDTEDAFEMAVEIKSRGARRGATGRIRGSGWPTVKGRCQTPRKRPPPGAGSPIRYATANGAGQAGWSRRSSAAIRSAKENCSGRR